MADFRLFQAILSDIWAKLGNIWGFEEDLGTGKEDANCLHIMLGQFSGSRPFDVASGFKAIWPL